MRLIQLAALAAPLALLLSAGPSFAEGHQRDSDDYNCNHGSLDDPRTLTACEHLRGGPVTMQEIEHARSMGFQRSSDDYRCHHGRPGARRTVEACRRLRGE
jgi:hypothetical protein